MRKGDGEGNSARGISDRGAAGLRQDLGLSWPRDMDFEKMMYAAEGKGLTRIMMRYQDGFPDAGTLLFEDAVF